MEREEERRMEKPKEDSIRRKESDKVEPEPRRSRKGSLEPSEERGGRDESEERTKSPKKEESSDSEKRKFDRSEKKTGGEERNRDRSSSSSSEKRSEEPMEPRAESSKKKRREDGVDSPSRPATPQGSPLASLRVTRRDIEVRNEERDREGEVRLNIEDPDLHHSRNMTHLPTLPLIMALANEAGAENPPEGWSSPRQLPKEWIEATGDSITLGAAEPEVSRLTARREAAAEAAFDHHEDTLQSPSKAADEMFPASPQTGFKSDSQHDHVETHNLGPPERHEVVAAHTTLLIPFTWADPTNANTSKFVNPLLRRSFVGQDGQINRVWQLQYAPPPQVTELDRRFRRQLGYDQKYVAQVAESELPQLDERGDDVVWRLQLSPEAMSLFFPAPRIVCFVTDATTGIEREFVKRVGFLGVTLAVYPLGTAILQYHVNWLPTVPSEPRFKDDRPDSDTGKKKSTKKERRKEKEKMKEEERAERRERLNPSKSAKNAKKRAKGKGMKSSSLPLTLDDLRTFLYLIKFRHRVPGVFPGWIFGPPDPVSDWETGVFPHSHISSLGSHMSESIYEGRPMTISHMSNWLLAHPDDNIDQPYQVVGEEKRSFHHTSVVMAKRLRLPVVRQYLFHLRRAKGQTNRPPEHDHALDKVMQLRQNRFLGISREGIVSLSWPITSRPDDFEIVGWPLHFQTIYRLLAAFVYAERATLAEMSHLSALAGEKLKSVGLRVDIHTMSKSRKEILGLVALMTRYTLQMSSDDCGGQSDYVEFFTSCRGVFKIREVRKELGSELNDVLRIIEQQYFLEERAMRKEQRQAAAEKDQRRMYFDVFVGLLTAITLPFVVVGGIFGMNNNDLPKDTPFLSIIYGCIIGVVSLASIFTLLAIPRSVWCCKQCKDRDNERKIKVLKKEAELLPASLGNKLSLYIQRPFNRMSLAAKPVADVQVKPDEEELLIPLEATRQLGNSGDGAPQHLFV